MKMKKRQLNSRIAFKVLLQMYFVVLRCRIEDLEKQMLEVKGLFAGIKKKSLQKKINALKDQI